MHSHDREVDAVAMKAALVLGCIELVIFLVNVVGMSLAHKW